MNCFFIVYVPLLILSFVLHSAVSYNFELNDKLNRELHAVEELKNSHRARINSLFNKRATPTRSPTGDSIPELARNLEAFLQRVIPNHSLVQDLMGYVTMTNPKKRRNIKK